MATKKSIDGKEKPIEEFDEISEDKLKSLLEEAMGYKSPPDANDKSEMFQKLLKNAKEEEERQNSLFDSDTFFSLKQSNSLQNLQDEHYHSQMSNSHQTYTSSKKHHRRSKNNATSVSTRRLEGGSLPVDMHFSLNDQPFNHLSEWKNNSNKKRKEKFKETVIDIGDLCDDDRKLMQRNFDSTMKDVIVAECQMDDGIEMKSVNYKSSVEMEVDDQSRYATVGQPIATILTVRSDTLASKHSSSCDVDKTIQFTPLTEKANSYQQQYHIDLQCASTINQNNIVLTNQQGLNRSAEQPVQLHSGYPSVSSLTNDKLSSQKSYKSEGPPPVSTSFNPQSSYPQQQPNTTTQKESKGPKSKKEKSKNEIVRIAKEIDGNQGHMEIDELLNFIGDDGASEVKSKKNNSKNGMSTSEVMNSDEKKKKVSPKNEEKVNKLKKSNSCEELTSTGRQKQQGEKEKLSTAAANKNFNEVTLRSKSGVNPSSGAKKGDNKSDQSQSKRNERRSWGNEGLRTETNVETQEKELDSSSSTSSHQSETQIVEIQGGDWQPIQPVDEFQTVIKKRKVKRKSSETGDIPKANAGNLQSYKRDGKLNDSTIRPGLRNNPERDNKNSKAGKSHNQESKGTKSRRKSTSSMPRSDDDESDDNDSVQSLPIETTKTTSSQLLSERKRDKQQQQLNSQQQNKPATFSYADIAKTSGARNSSGSNGSGGMTPSIQKWPLISESSVSSHQTSNIIEPFALVNSPESVKNQPQSQQPQHVQKSTASSLLTKKLSYPELVESNNNKNKQLSSLSNSDVNVNGGKAAKQLNGAVDSSDTNNNGDNQKVSYSQSLLDGNDAEFIDTNGNNVANSKVDAKTMLTKSKSVDQNNLTSIDQYPALERTQTTSSKVDKNCKVVAAAKPQPQLQQQQSPPQMQQSVKMNDVRSAKKLKKSASCQQSASPPSNNVVTSTSSAWSTATASIASNCRPAVIILNDYVNPNVDCGITFGFDINDDLLSGHPTNGEASADEQTGTCTTDISLVTNNNNTCDITNTNLSNNNLNNQIAPAESYENYTQTQHNNESQGAISGQSLSLSLLSPSQPNQQQHQNINIATDSSNTSNDIEYLTSTVTNSANSSLPLPAANNNISNETSSTSATVNRSQVIRRAIEIPRFRSPADPLNFRNQEEVALFVSDEWTKASNGTVFQCQ